MGSSVQDIDQKVNEEIREYKKGMEMDIKMLCEHMKHCKFKQFKVLMMKLDMGVEIKGASGSAMEKINPFSKIYFYDKNNLKEAKEVEWKEVPIFPMPE